MTNQAVQTGDFARDQQAALATRDTIARALLVELATLPITTSSGGFSFRFNPALGTVERAEQSFGPFFIDRATTAGRNQASLSMTYRYSSYKSLDGTDLQGGALVTTANKFRDEATPFDVDTLSLTINTSTFTVFGNYGVTDWLDLGVAAPVVRLNLSGQRINTYRGASFEQARGTADTIGLADIAVRSKVLFFRSTPAQMAGDFEVRLPTGDVDNLRGAGRAAYKASLIVSAGTGPVEGHVNGGYIVGGISKEADVSGAVTIAPAGRLTLSLETMVRRIDALSEIRSVSQPSSIVSGMDTFRLLPGPGGTITSTAIAGFRWNVSGTWLLNGYVVVPLTDHGLKVQPVPAIAVDYSFVR